MILYPRILFLDEPTKGLDSLTALKIVQAINNLKESGITIICTIHQPSKKMMDLFDKIIVLAEGQIVYDDIPNKI